MTRNCSGGIRTKVAPSKPKWETTQITISQKNNKESILYTKWALLSVTVVTQLHVLKPN